MKTLLMSTVAALFVAGTAYAEDVKVLIDADEDGQITVEEWDASRAEMATVFGDWDADADTFLSRDEYEAYLATQDDADTFGTWDDYYVGWDADGDGMLSVDEYNSGLFAIYDADESGFWSQEESAAWEENEMRYDATRAGSEVSAPDAGGAAAGGAATQ